jgi:hypothetical protein
MEKSAELKVVVPFDDKDTMYGVSSFFRNNQLAFLTTAKKETDEIIFDLFFLKSKDCLKVTREMKIQLPGATLIVKQVEPTGE